MDRKRRGAPLAAVAASMRRLRRQAGLSLAELAGRSDVSAAMLSQVESGKTTPTIAVLWKIAPGLDVPFTSLLPREGGDAPLVLRDAETRTVVAGDRRFRSRPLVVSGPGRRVELYRLEVDPQGRSRTRPHAAGTVGLVTVACGRLRRTAGDQTNDLDAGDTVVFRAGGAPSNENPGRTRCVAYDVVTNA
jgi:transcriptional regulator with XRE-family HTH domain